MSRSAAAAAAAAAVGCGLLAAPSFLLPGHGSAAPERTVAAGTALRGAEGAVPSGPGSRACSPLAGLALAAAAAAGSRLRRGREAPRRVEVAAFESELGVQAPAGFWDPLEFCRDGDAAAFKRRRTVEIKHGRIAMYACIGFITPEYVRWPGDLSPSADLKFTDVPNGLAAFSKVPIQGWLQILFFCGLIERTGFTFTQFKDIGTMKDASMAGEPGNYGLGTLGAFNTIPTVKELRKRKLNAELANGRLAMVAIMGMLFQNGTLGTTGPDMWWFEGLPEYAGTVGDFIPKNL